jgi:C4-dicarboxylate transporter DctM subunit
MYVILNISGITMKEFTKEIWPMLIALIGVLFVITYYPPLVLWIPNLLMGVAK